MITIYTEQDAQALADDTLRELVRGHLITVKENGLENLTCIAIVEPADSEQAFLDKLTAAKSSDRYSLRRS